MKVAEVGGSFVGVQAGQRGEGIIVEQAGNTRFFRAGFRVGDHVLQASLVIPALREDAVERTQREAAGILELQRPRRLKVGGDAERVPAYVNRLVDERRGRAEGGGPRRV